ncbi:MAG: hypothetical protein K9M54_09515 [Kiritimatiellales bacterium]|nr:hypothetical protein [Kiritimatiellales bacterium]
MSMNFPADNKTSPMRWLDRLPFFLFICYILFFAANPFSLLDFPLDDAWIHRVYSRAFAFGHGFAYNPGQQEAGSTPARSGALSLHRHTGWNHSEPMR